MSFICKVCGPVENGLKQFRIPTKIRDVSYNLQVRTIYADGESTRIVGSVKGLEIVEEASYCKDHVPEEFEPIKEGEIARNQLIKVITMRKNNEEQGEEEETNGKASRLHK